MSENKNTFEPPVVNVLTGTFDQNTVGASEGVSWSIGEIPDINK